MLGSKKSLLLAAAILALSMVINIALILSNADYSSKLSTANSRYVAEYKKNRLDKRVYAINTNASANAETDFRVTNLPEDYLPLVGDFDGDGKDSVSYYSKSRGELYIANQSKDAPADSIVTLGALSSSQNLVAGDWNGDGIDTYGIYDGATGQFKLFNSLNPENVANPDKLFTYGPAANNWVPFAGDWDGDKADGVGLFDGSTALFYLKNALSEGVADVQFQLGDWDKGYGVVIGDWNGDGSDTVGLYDRPNAAFYLVDVNESRAVDYDFTFGPVDPKLTPLAGDWNGDKTSTPALYGTIPVE